VWFHLFDASPEAVGALLSEAGCQRVGDDSWNYPAGPQAVVYISLNQAGSFDPGSAITPGAQTEVLADVSGRVPGDDEVRFLAKLLLSCFRGIAFDDFMSDTHAWTLAEINAGKRFGGLAFFDYLGAYR
jgi:hypothetical protein